jgi:hypothetical protein
MAYDVVVSYSTKNCRNSRRARIQRNAADEATIRLQRGTRRSPRRSAAHPDLFHDAQSSLSSPIAAAALCRRYPSQRSMRLGGVPKRDSASDRYRQLSRPYRLNRILQVLRVLIGYESDRSHLRIFSPTKVMCGVPRAEVVVVAGTELHLAARLYGERAIAVKFELMDPWRALRQFLSAQEQHRLDETVFHGHQTSLRFCQHRRTKEGDACSDRTRLAASPEAVDCTDPGHHKAAALRRKHRSRLSRTHARRSA